MMDRRGGGWFKSLNCDGRYGLALAGLCVLLVALSLAGTPLRDALQFDRDAIAKGQWWRLIGAHLVHQDGHHLLLNLTGLVLLWMLFARELSPLRWLIVAVVSMLAVDAGLWWLLPQLAWYLGASGMLHGIWAAGALAGLRRGDRTGIGLTVLLAVKLVAEQWYGPRSMEPSVPVVIEAHTFGAVGGAAVVLLDWARARLTL